MRQHLIYLPILIFAFAVGIASAQATRPGPPSTEPGSSAGPAGTMNDNAALHQSSADIEHQIRLDLAKHNLNGVDVSVDRSTIVLTGNVASKSEHDNALEIARSVGQKNRRIEDQIKVNGQ